MYCKWRSKNELTEKAVITCSRGFFGVKKYTSSNCRLILFWLVYVQITKFKRIGGSSTPNLFPILGTAVSNPDGNETIFYSYYIITYLL